MKITLWQNLGVTESLPIRVLLGVSMGFAWNELVIWDNWGFVGLLTTCCNM